MGEVEQTSKEKRTLRGENKTANKWEGESERWRERKGEGEIDKDKQTERGGRERE